MKQRRTAVTLRLFFFAPYCVCICIYQTRFLFFSVLLYVGVVGGSQNTQWNCDWVSGGINTVGCGYNDSWEQVFLILGRGWDPDAEVWPAVAMPRFARRGCWRNVQGHSGQKPPPCFPTFFPFYWVQEPAIGVRMAPGLLSNPDRLFSVSMSQISAPTPPPTVG